MQAEGRVFKYGDNVDTDVIIPARYLNATTGEELAKHCMEDIDKEFIHKVQPGDIIVAEKNFGCGSSREHAPVSHQVRRRQLCHCRDLCQDLLPQCHQYRPSHHRVSGSRCGHPGRRPGGGGF